MVIMIIMVISILTCQSHISKVFSWYCICEIWNLYIRQKCVKFDYEKWTGLRCLSIMMGRWWAGRGGGRGGRERTGQSRPSCPALIHTPQSTHPPICHRIPDNNSNHSTSSIIHPQCCNCIQKYAQYPHLEASRCGVHCTPHLLHDIKADVSNHSNWQIQRISLLHRQNCITEHENEGFWHFVPDPRVRIGRGRDKPPIISRNRSGCKIRDARCC